MIYAKVFVINILWHSYPFFYSYGLLQNMIYGTGVIIKKFGCINEDISVTDSHAVKLKMDAPWRTPADKFRWTNENDLKIVNIFMMSSERLVIITDVEWKIIRLEILSSYRWTVKDNCCRNSRATYIIATKKENNWASNLKKNTVTVLPLTV